MKNFFKDLKTTWQSLTGVEVFFACFMLSIVSILGTSIGIMIFKLIIRMKVLIFLLLMVTTISVANSQSKVTQLYVEIKDTVEVAYKKYLGDWELVNGMMSRKMYKDSIGIDTIRRITPFYIDYIQEPFPKGENIYVLKPYTIKKVYLNTEIKYINKSGKTKNVDLRFSGF